MIREPTDEEISGVTWDAIIVGSGMGGSVLAHGLASGRSRILLVERGANLLEDQTAIRGRRAEEDEGYAGDPGDTLERCGRETRSIEISGRVVLPEVGSGLGGSTALFGGVLERFFPDDFQPGARFEADGSDLPVEWPLTYGEMEPWYERAESLFAVTGGPDPRRQGVGAPSVSAWPSPATALLAARLQERGLSPYRLRRGRSDPDCGGCQGHLCPRSCKPDAGRLGVRPAMEHGLEVVCRTEAEFIEADGSRVRSIRLRRRGVPIEARARVFVLALGALRTPAMLLASRSSEWPDGLANGSGAVGRYLMRHAIDIWALRGAPPVATPADAKEIGFNDFYQEGRTKLGSVQSFGAPPSLSFLRRQRPVGWAWRFGALSAWLWRRYNRTPLMVAILEDFPYARNRVVLGSEGMLKVEYAPGQSETRRRLRLRSHLRQAFSGLGGVPVSKQDAPRALGHVCGTCRFGRDPRTSVLDRDNKAHELENLYVVDASFFPSSAGINPALTVAANSLRVAATLRQVLD